MTSGITRRGGVRVAPFVDSLLDLDAAVAIPVILGVMAAACATAVTGLGG
jgi:hypothetical protein